MRRWIAKRILRGTTSPPGTGLIQRELEADKNEVTILFRGDSFDVYHGNKTITSYAMSPRVAVRLAWFVFWVVYVRATWCGLRTRLWYWASARLLEAKKYG